MTGVRQTATSPTSDRGGGYPASWVLGILLLAGVIGLLGFDFSREVQGVLVLAMTIVLIVAKVPVAIAMTVPGIVGIYVIAGPRPLRQALIDIPLNTAGDWSLSVIPMFVFMGVLLWHSGVSAQLFEAARRLGGWMPGGLAVATNLSGAGLAAASGSTLAITYAVGRVSIPEMLSRGYDKRLATASVLMAGTGGQLIPPSILLVVYAGVAQTPVGPQLLAGLVPGILIALAYTLVIVLACSVKKELAPPRDSIRVLFSREGLVAVIKVWPLPLLTLVVLGGIYSGIFTATEAGAFGAFAALLITVLFVPLRGLGPVVGNALRSTVSSVGAILFLLIGAMLLNQVLALSGITRALIDFLLGADLTRVQFLLLLLLFYLFLGMFMDPFTTMVLTVPLVAPLLGAFDISALWFGVFVVLMGELSVVTPPVGVLTFVVHGLAQEPEVSLGHEISLGSVFAGTLFFVPVSVIVVILMMAFPDLVEWLPSVMR